MAKKLLKKITDNATKKGAKKSELDPIEKKIELDAIEKRKEQAIQTKKIITKNFEAVLKKRKPVKVEKEIKKDQKPDNKIITQTKT